MGFMDILGDVREGSSGFISSIGESIETGVRNVAESDILPRWVGNELGLQSKDQLATPTFDETAALPRIDSKPGTNSVDTAQGVPGNMINTGTVLTIALVSVAAYLVFTS